MSQVSFLESVVSWSETQCRQNLQDALPKLISHLQEAVYIQEEIGILKIICLSFLPWVQIHEAEQLVFCRITAKSCSMMDKVLESIKSLPKQSSGKEELQALLEALVEILDCFTVCMRFAHGGGNSVDIGTVHSLPHGAVYLLKQSYNHCKESGELYGDILPALTESLSLLFKKAHALQVALLGLLENISVGNEVSQQNVDDLCFVCQSLFEVCQIVTSLDMKLVVSLWKSISRLSGRHKNWVKDTLNVDDMVMYLCMEITNGYKYLLQLAPPDDDRQELSLSQGDGAAFQKSLKLLGYQLRVTMSLLDNFIQDVSECMTQILEMVTDILRCIPPSLETVKISQKSIEDIRRHLVNGIEPLLQLVVTNRTFLSLMVQYAKDVKSESRLAVVQVLVKIGDSLPKHTDEVMKSWMSLNAEGTNHCIFDLIFFAVDQCYMELSSSLSIQSTQGCKDVPLYDYICVHMCGLVGSLSGKYFNVLEMCLLKQLFSCNTYASSMAEDVWCFMARFGSANLCYQHTKLLSDLCCATGFPYNVVKLTRRLIKFLAPDHQNQIMKTFAPGSHVRYWCEVIVPAIPSSVPTAMWTVLYNCVTKPLQDFISKNNKSYLDLVSLLQNLKNLEQLICYYSNGEEAGRSETLPVATETIQAMLSIWNIEWSGETICTKCLSRLTELSGLIVSDLKNEDFIKIFDLLLLQLKTGDLELKLSACGFLQRCKKVKFPPDSAQPLILKKIPTLFHTLLTDSHPIVHHTALRAFTVFAECTPYETLVPQCLADNQALQDKVVAFLSKTPCINDKYQELKYMTIQFENLIKQQKDVALHQQQSMEHSAARDMLDDIQAFEPATKRKKLDDTIDEMGTVLTDLEDNVKRLESLMSNSTINSEYKSRLTDVNTKLTNILGLL